MALTATIFNLAVELSDVDRGVYETLDLRVARQPSETPEYMLMRVLAYCLEYEEGIEFTQGVASGDEPAVMVRDLTGRITAWIEVGMPDADRLHRGSKAAERATVYTHRDIRQVLENLSGKKIHRGADIPVYTFDRAFVDDVAAAIDRRTELNLSITERQLYIGIGQQTYHTEIHEHRLP
ncbi:MAG: YaeQ family protein [Acidobacteria bacterium]|nr:YaeQ family protein [Acidobacteriota bacterium]